ncbi:Glucosamine-6-phosphate isomerase (Glucosamine-6-phosphate deaminase) (GNPDA) (GlcN6P deaminase) [Conoideocrella luteorostrata]|uniref:Beta-hexosaminidase n=1 Tax=Conoideocrella luteorostrata TaxID=1105319 RepID=A0AAJ0G1L6_9HYPO|nr:Glucosamine-6-phosphate isomerase (Glucosamine-6-phosphate deaminase) (GNPDA) (GlcN6P deaminase) [Conoideocrella luteorostrata]
MLKALVTLAAFAALSPVSAIWPVPQQISTGSDILFIEKSIKVTYNGEPVRWNQGCPHGEQRESHLTNGAVKNEQVALNNNHALTTRTDNVTGKSPFNSKQVVKGGVARSFKAIFEHGLIPWMLNPPGSDFEPAVGKGKGAVKSLTITQTGKDNSTVFKPLAGSVDESYSLNLTSGGEASITAATSTGILRALESFTQLFFKHSSGNVVYTKLAPVTIQDAPRFPHRGMLLDLGRHWFAVEDIKRTIDALAMAKMNIMHLHITETQSWPLEIPALPKLSEKGRYAPGLTYSPRDIKEIQEYATLRGVQVVLEIDMPGHFGVEKAYPGLSVAYNAKPYSTYCAQPPCGALKLNNTDVEKFLSTLFDDLLPRLNTYASYFHTGGDEYKAANSLLDPNLKTSDMKVLKPMLQRFLDHAHKKVREHGLVPMVWEEMVGEWGANVGNDTIIQSWFGRASVQKLATAGHKVIDSSTDVYYLDCGRGEWIDYREGASAYPYNDWCSPTKNWRVIYTHDPIANMSESVAKNVIGGEVAVWTETIDPTSLDSIVWPRAAAAGEGWWSGRKDSKGKDRSLYKARPRLEEMRERMLVRGVRGAPISQLFCEQSPIGDCTA